MAAKRKARPRRKAGKNAFEKQMGDFGDEVGELGDKFGRRMERHGKAWERKGKEWDNWFHRTFGLVGPLISSVLGIVIVALVIWVMAFINSKIGSWLLADINLFLTNNIGLFFLIFVFFSYTSYFSKFYHRIYMLFSPVSIAFGAAVCFWIVANVLSTVNVSIGSPVISAIAFHVSGNIFLLFWLFLCVGYLVLAAILVTKGVAYCREEEPAKAEKARPYRSREQEGIHRLYRSGKDRILGGVCGGIAEYLGVDPVIIRLLWVAGSLAWGFGILLYIICWIIIPRNPNHRWK